VIRPFLKASGFRSSGAIPEVRDKVVITFNPIAGRRPTKHLADRLASEIRRLGYHVYSFDDIWKASEAARELDGQRLLRAFVAVGGDGTFALQVNLTPPGMPLALLPAGTGNVTAKSLGLPKSPRVLARAIGRGKLFFFDAGLVNGKIFVNMVSCGFDAAVAARVHQLRQSNRRGGHINYGSYLGPIAEVLRHYPFPEIRVEPQPPAPSARINPGETFQELILPSSHDMGPKNPWGNTPVGGEVPNFRETTGHLVTEVNQSPQHSPADSAAAQWAEPIRCRWVFLCNMPRYGWGLPIAPGANPQDGLLNCWTFRWGSLWSGLWYVLWAQAGGLHRILPDCRHVMGSRFRITVSQPIPWQTDGDPAGTLTPEDPLQVEVLPRRIGLILP
jgi:diacylglycerol kinase family enzyme